MQNKLSPAELVKEVMCEKYFRDRFVGLDWEGYSERREEYESYYKVMKRKDSVTVKIEGGYNRLSEDERNEIVIFLKEKFRDIENVLDIKFMVGENYAGTKYDWLKIKLVV